MCTQGSVTEVANEICQTTKDSLDLLCQLLFILIADNWNAEDV